MNKNILKMLKKELRNVNNDHIKMFIYREMIKQNMYFGVAKYYEWMKVNKKTYSDELNKSISNVKKLRFIIIDLKMLQLTFDEKFNDRRFDSLYTNVRDSIVLIGKNNVFCKKIVSILIKLFILLNREHKHIGFVNYILIDLEANKKTDSDGMTIREIKKVLKNYQL
jgi:hypothetical protein